LDVAGLVALEFARALVQHVPDTTLAETPVREVMQKRVVTCAADERLSLASQRMFDERTGSLVVANARNEPIAMLTDRDIALAARSPDVPFAELRVRDAMSRAMHCCTPESNIVEATAVMRSARVRRLPVIDTAQRLIGVIALDDVAYYVQARTPLGIPTAIAADVLQTLAAVATPAVVGRRVARDSERAGHVSADSAS
jgi:CBS domain-containing protein